MWKSSKLVTHIVCFPISCTLNSMEKSAIKSFRLNYKCDCSINPLSANFTKWSNTLKQLVGNLPNNCLSVFDHFVGLVLKGLRILLL